MSGWILQMGAPKQKWTAEEEAALKAGVIKHGAGKWRTILTDPEFSSILHQRSNVDLKVPPPCPHTSRSLTTVLSHRM